MEGLCNLPGWAAGGGGGGEDDAITGPEPGCDTGGGEMGTHTLTVVPWVPTTVTPRFQPTVGWRNSTEGRSVWVGAGGRLCRGAGVQRHLCCNGKLVWSSGEHAGLKTDWETTGTKARGGQGYSGRGFRQKR